MKHLLIIFLCFIADFLYGQLVFQPIDDSVPKFKNDSIRVIHLTDIHLNSDKKKDPATRNFVDCCSFIRDKFLPSSTVILITGDFSHKKNDNPSEKAWDFYRSERIIRTYLKNKGFRVMIVPGNHDYGKGGLKVLTGGETLFNTVFSIETFPDTLILQTPKLLFIGLNSMGELKPKGFDCRNLSKGKLGKPQRDSLRSILKKHKDYSKIVFMHHAAFDSKSNKTNRIIKDHKELDTILNQHKKVFFLNGHRHIKQQFKHEKIKIIESNSLAGQKRKGEENYEENPLGFYMLSFPQKAIQK